MKTPLDRGAFKARVATGEVTYGTFIGLASPVAVEIAAIAGVDWVLLDLEHGAGGEEQVGPTVLASGAYGVPTLVRVESEERIRIGRVLDAGVAGVMVPRVENVNQVKEVVKHMSTPPYGDRGVATYNRSARWGRDLEFLNGPSKATCIIQIETNGALDSVDEIAAVEGVDVLFIGPADLSFALGVPRDFKSPKFIAALEKVLAACNKNKVAAGILAFTPEAAVEYKNMGFKFIAINSDSTLLAGAITNSLEIAKGAK
jgi:2-dehydro-3-deoxyglucarate aldolase/4-hydroxy-2-oxoheptanedioate aldolase